MKTYNTSEIDQDNNDWNSLRNDVYEWKAKQEAKESQKEVEPYYLGGCI